MQNARGTKAQCAMLVGWFHFSQPALKFLNNSLELALHGENEKACNIKSLWNKMGRITYGYLIVVVGFLDSSDMVRRLFHQVAHERKIMFSYIPFIFIKYVSDSMQLLSHISFDLPPDSHVWDVINAELLHLWYIRN